MRNSILSPRIRMHGINSKNYLFSKSSFSGKPRNLGKTNNMERGEKEKRVLSQFLCIIIPEFDQSNTPLLTCFTLWVFRVRFLIMIVIIIIIIIINIDHHFHFHHFSCTCIVISLFALLNCEMFLPTAF